MIKYINMVDVKELIKTLNEEQIKPVLDTEGAVLVIAGAGSGKTRVLTTRISYLVQEKNVPISNILAITFTNKAANEMKERLGKILGDVGELWVCTIHSMCVKILRSFIDRLGYDKNFTIYDETDRDKTIKRILEDLDLEYDKFFKLAKGQISMAKNECVGVEDFENVYADLVNVEELAKIYSEYEKTLNRSNSLDFDDLLFKTYILFRDYPEVADYYSNKFEYIHIDEFQDTNRVQFAIAQRLSIKHGNIFVVGDDDQSIYGWRGAKIENILTFDDVYRGAKVYKLQRNYRSTKKILELANCIIKNNRQRRKKELFTDNAEGVKVDLFVGQDENEEASYTVLQIKKLMERTDLKYKDFAVFMRLNALSRAYEQEFTKYGIPYRVFGGFRFFERKEIKDVLAYLKVINNTFDDESFIRSAGVPKRGIGEKSLSDLREFAVGRGLSMYDAIDYLELSGITGATRTKLVNYKLLLASFREYSQKNPTSKTIEYILETTSFLEQFTAERNDENNSKLYNISELKNSAEEFERTNFGSTLADYLSSVTLSSDTDDIKTDDAVTVATIHSAKGLEYKCVFVAGLDEKVLPIARSMGDDDELEEERRLMYVAVTRARERLHLTRATSRYMYGRREFMTQSRFLKEAKDVLYPERVEETPKYSQTPNYYRTDYSKDEDTYMSRTGYSSNYAKTFLSQTKPKTNAGNNSKGYKSGVKVKHAKFGEGTVIMVKGEGNNLIVDVAFKGVGIKSLSVAYAPMEIL